MVLTFMGSLGNVGGGGGTLNLTFAATGDTFEVEGLSNNFTGTTNSTNGGTFIVSHGTFGRSPDRK